MMHKRYNPFLLPCYAVLAAIMLAPLTACYSPYAGRDDVLDVEDYPQIAASKYTNDRLRFSPPIIEPDAPDRPMRVTVPVRSIHSFTNLNIQYRFIFLDEFGRPLQRNNVDEWRYKALPPRNAVFLDGNALDTGAKDWRLEVRLAD